MAALSRRIDASRLIFIDESWTKTNMGSGVGRHAARG
jgi:hypothetical protein